MAKIPFTLEAWLKDKSQKIETAFGEPAKVVFAEGLGKYPILAVIYDGDTTDSAWFTKDGKSYDGVYGLFIVTPEEEELNEFEKTLVKLVKLCDVTCGSEVDLNECIKSHSIELLELAKKELEEEVPEMEFIPIENTLEYKAGFRAGRAEALKDLPRWEIIKKDDNAIVRIPLVGTNMLGESMLYIGENAISISCLMKLPGFKEDESHE